MVFPDGGMRKWKARLQASVSHPDQEKRGRQGPLQEEGGSHILSSTHLPFPRHQRPCVRPHGLRDPQGLHPPRAGRDEAGNGKPRPHISHITPYCTGGCFLCL